MRAAGLRARAVRGYRAKAGIRARFAHHPKGCGRRRRLGTTKSGSATSRISAWRKAGAISRSCWIITRVAWSRGRSVGVALRVRPAPSSTRRYNAVARHAAWSSTAIGARSTWRGRLCLRGASRPGAERERARAEW